MRLLTHLHFSNGVPLLTVEVGMGVHRESSCAEPSVGATVCRPAQRERPDLQAKQSARPRREVPQSYHSAELTNGNVVVRAQWPLRSILTANSLAITATSLPGNPRQSVAVHWIFTTSLYFSHSTTAAFIIIVIRIIIYVCDNKT